MIRRGSGGINELQLIFNGFVLKRRDNVVPFFCSLLSSVLYTVLESSDFYARAISEKEGFILYRKIRNDRVSLLSTDKFLIRCLGER